MITCTPFHISCLRRVFKFEVASLSATPQYSRKWKMFKPFKPPLLKSVVKSSRNSFLDTDSGPISIPDSDSEPESRPLKKRKLLIVEDRPPPINTSSSSAALAPRKPLLVVKNPTETKTIADVESEGPEGYYMVLW